MAALTDQDREILRSIFGHGDSPAKQGKTKMEWGRGLGGCLGIFPVWIVVALIRVWAISLLWDWFVTPAFGVCNPGFWTILGLIITLHIIRAPGSENKYSTWTEYYTGWFMILIFQAYVFGIATLIHFLG